MIVTICVVSVFVGVSGISFTENEHLLPPLFHLDDYDRCLAHRNGLYCLGTFELTSVRSSNPVYKLIQEFSREKTNFNRTLIHRGYCLSKRCPSNERNASLRFERCVDERAGLLSLNARLSSLDYCRTREQVKADIVFDTPLAAFTYVIGFLILLNSVGTLYDCCTADDDKKNILVSWSVRHNWRKLTRTESNNNSNISTVQGVRVSIMIFMIMVHNGMLHHTVYLQNPLYVEEMTRHPLMMIIQNGTPAVQIYTLFSTFLGVYYLLKSSPDGEISLRTTIKHIIKRIFRLTPVHLLVVGFAATWWPLMSNGPLWARVVKNESSICRRKFWYHFLYVSNLVDPADDCLVPTWFLCVDVQLHIVGAIGTYILAKVNNKIRILTALCFTSCAVNAVLAYLFNWTAIMYVVQSPEEVRVLYQNSPSYYLFYTAPWGGLPTCFLGMIAAHCMVNNKKEITKELPKKSPGIWSGLVVHLSVPLVLSWMIMGNFIRDVTSKVFLAVYAAVDRVLFLALATVAILASSKNVVLKGLLSWRGMQPLSRLSLPVMLIHWCLNLYLIGSRSRTYDMSVFNMMMDGTAVAFISYLIAVPVSLLIELPIQNFVDSLLA